jgi:hypothetical protein
VEPEETAVARQWYRKHILAAMNIHATTEELESMHPVVLIQFIILVTIKTQRLFIV